MRYRTLIIAMLAAWALAGCAKAGMPSGGPKDEIPPKVLGTEPENGSTNWTAKEFAILFDEYVVVKDADKNILVSPPMNTKPEYGTKGRAVVVKIKDTLRANTTYLFQFKEGIADFNEGNPLASYEYVFSTGSSIDSMTIRGQVLDALTRKPYQSEGVITVVAFGAEQMQRFDSVQNVYLDSLLHADTTGALMGKVDKTNLGDSIVAKEKPLYITHCDKDGNFEMNHLREGYYMVLAFEDSDNNLLLKAGEAVAFLDTLVLAERMPPIGAPKADSTKMDTSSASGLVTEPAELSVQTYADTLERNSIGAMQAGDDSTQSQEVGARSANTRLYISLYKEEVQRLAKAEFKNKGQIMLATVLPLTEHYLLRPLDTAAWQEIYLRSNPRRDTLDVWTADRNCDSIVLLLEDEGIRDTLNLVYRATQDIASGAKAPAKAKSKEARLLNMRVAPKHPYFDTLWIDFERPVKGIAYGAPDSLVTIFNQADSTTSYCGVKWSDAPNTTGHCRAMIDFKGKPGGKYKFAVPAKSFCDIYGATHHDSLTFSTEYTKVEEYGNIVLTIDSLQFATYQGWRPSGAGQPVPDNAGLDGCSRHGLIEDSLVAQNTVVSAIPVLVQLLNEKGEVLRQRTIHEPGKVSFEHLKGGKYALRAVADSDGNGIWTAGDYWKHRQPEDVVYFEKVLELRENWDMEEHWVVRFGAVAAPWDGEED